MNADLECSGCISVRSCRSAAEAITPQLSAIAKHLVPRARSGPLDHEQKESWKTPTFHKQTGRLRRPEGCKNPSVNPRKHIRFTMKNPHCKSQGVLNKGAGSGSSGCISVRSCRSAAAAAFRDCGASGSASAARTSGPCAVLRALRRPFRGMRGS